MKQFKAIYTKKFTAEKEDAVSIAKLHQPKDAVLENVIECKYQETCNPVMECIFDKFNLSNKPKEKFDVVTENIFDGDL